MRIVISEFISLDGVIQAPGGPEEDTDGGFEHGGWSLPFFDPEVMGDVFLIDVTQLEDERLRSARPTDKPVATPKGKSWPVFMSFTRGRQQAQRPMFSVSAQVFENGVLDRLTVDTGLVTVTADLQKLEMRPAPNCPRS